MWFFSPKKKKVKTKEKKGGKRIHARLLIFKIIINSRPFVLRHTLLLLIDFSNCPTGGRFLGLLVLPLLDETWEPQTDPLPGGSSTTVTTTSATRVVIGIITVAEQRQMIGCGSVPGAERQIGRLDLPDEAGLEPDVRLILVAGRVGVEGFRSVDDVLGLAELGVELFEDGVRETGAYVADGLKGLGGGVVAGEKEGAVDGRTFASAVVGTKDDQIEGVTNTGEIVFLDLHCC